MTLSENDKYFHLREGVKKCLGCATAVEGLIAETRNLKRKFAEAMAIIADEQASNGCTGHRDLLLDVKLRDARIEGLIAAGDAMLGGMHHNHAGFKYVDDCDGCKRSQAWEAAKGGAK